MNKIPLRLGREPEPSVAQRGAPAQEAPPVLGWFAVGFGVLGIFGPGLIFTPLGLLFSILALLRGQAGWGFVGLLLAVGGFLSSPLLMGIVGLSAAWVLIDWEPLLRPVYEMWGGGTDI